MSGLHELPRDELDELLVERTAEALRARLHQDRMQGAGEWISAPDATDRKKVTNERLAAQADDFLEGGDLLGALVTLAKIRLRAQLIPEEAMQR
jgi:hypothetical protein